NSLGFRYHAPGLWCWKRDTECRQISTSGNRRCHYAVADTGSAGVVQTPHTNMKHLARCIFILILALPLKGQDGPAPFVMSVNSDFMELHVSVVDEKDRNVGGLTMENFRIKENGVPQPI